MGRGEDFICLRDSWGCREEQRRFAAVMGDFVSPWPKGKLLGKSVAQLSSLVFV